MANGATLREEARDLGEVVSNGVRYRVFFDSKRHCTVCVPVAGQEHLVGAANSMDRHGHV